MARAWIIFEYRCMSHTHEASSEKNVLLVQKHPLFKSAVYTCSENRQVIFQYIRVFHGKLLGNYPHRLLCENKWMKKPDRPDSGWFDIQSCFSGFFCQCKRMLQFQRVLIRIPGHVIRDPSADIIIPRHATLKFPLHVLRSMSFREVTHAQNLL